MSTTPDLRVAVAYSVSDCSLIFKLRTKSFLQRGADLTFLSVRPSLHPRPFGSVTLLASPSPLLAQRQQSCVTVALSCARPQAFPGESECLFPPLTYLRPTGREVELDFRHMHFRIVEVEPTQ
eukprot:6512620-Prymnesium_polylepis.1